MPYSLPYEVIDAVEAAAREGRIVQGEWRRRDKAGKELVGALAAFGSTINSPADCPAEYMPAWLTELIPVLGDGMAAERVAEFVLARAASARQWRLLKDASWDVIHCEFLCGCIEYALRMTATVQPTPKPAYWTDVQERCGAVIAALRSGGDLAEARAAVEPWAIPEGVLAFAPGPANATWAARCGAEAAWRGAAQTRWAAQSAAVAAAGVKFGDQAAGAAAYWSLGRCLLSLFNAEAAATKGWRAHLGPDASA